MNDDSDIKNNQNEINYNQNEIENHQNEIENHQNDIKNNQKKLPQESKEVYKSLAPFLNLGIQMALTIGVFVLLGWWLDGRFDKSPVFTLIFSFVGIFGSFYNFFRIVVKQK